VSADRSTPRHPLWFRLWFQARWHASRIFFRFTWWQYALGAWLLLVILWVVSAFL
jgi:hypothetical protein